MENEIEPFCYNITTIIPSQAIYSFFMYPHFKEQNEWLSNSKKNQARPFYFDIRKKKK